MFPRLPVFGASGFSLKGAGRLILEFAKTPWVEDDLVVLILLVVVRFSRAALLMEEMSRVGDIVITIVSKTCVDGLDMEVAKP